MIRSIFQLQGYELEALDGTIGKVGDFLFDEVLWTVRYLVADTGGWLTGRRVLLPPSVLEKPQWKDRSLPVRLKKDQIENSPSIDEHAPVSRQHEVKLHRYWDVRPYWVGGIAAGVHPIPEKTAKMRDEEMQARYEGEEADPFLRSAEEVKGYHIQATDDEIGHVEDFLFDDESWVIRYLVVDTRNWLPGKKVLVPLVWIADISWADKMVKVDVSREIVKNSPEFDPSSPINREQEEVLYDYYGRPKYWAVK